MMSTPTTRAANGQIGLSVAWGYVLGILLMLFVLLILVPDADGPSPWDPLAFRSGMLEMLANFRILDELADMGIVRVADVGSGFVSVDLDLIGVSNRSFGWGPFLVALALIGLSLLVRAIRQRLLASHFGFPHSGKGQTASYFYGRGMNLFFPFGPGDLAIARALDGGEGSSEAAAAVVFHNRLFELLAILAVLLVGLVYLGWGGALTALFWTVFVVAATVSLTRPLGWSSEDAARFNIFAKIWTAFNGRALRQALGKLLATPGFLVGILVVSVAALLMEVLAFWSLKQAFSSPMEDYVLMKDLPLLQFTITVAAAGITRIIPYTFASFGIYETASVVMFWVFGEGFLSGTTVALLDSALINGMTLIFFVLSLRVSACPSILETWRIFLRRSALQAPV